MVNGQFNDRGVCVCVCVAGGGSAVLSLLFVYPEFANTINCLQFKPKVFSF